MSGFYSLPAEANPGRTQMRIAYVQPPERMRLVPELFNGLLQRFLKRLEQAAPVSAQVRG
jgi:aspartate aminotransferase